MTTSSFAKVKPRRQTPMVEYNREHHGATLEQLIRIAPLFDGIRLGLPTIMVLFAVHLNNKITCDDIVVMTGFEASKITNSLDTLVKGGWIENTSPSSLPGAYRATAKTVVKLNRRR